MKVVIDNDKTYIKEAIVPQKLVMSLGEHWHV